jgi:hypothetical protein
MTLQLRTQLQVLLIRANKHKDLESISMEIETEREHDYEVNRNYLYIPKPFSSSQIMHQGHKNTGHALQTETVLSLSFVPNRGNVMLSK